MKEIQPHPKFGNRERLNMKTYNYFAGYEKFDFVAGMSISSQTIH